MKKVMLRLGSHFVVCNMRTTGKIILFLSPMFLCIMCERFPSPNSSGEWFVKNSTDQTITITVPPYSIINSYPLDNNIAPGNTIPLLGHVIYNETIPRFELLLDCWHNSAEEDIFFEVLSKDGVLLKKWNYSDKGLPDKQFFKEAWWHHYQDSEGSYVWVFDILPEDLSPEPAP